MNANIEVGKAIKSTDASAIIESLGIDPNGSVNRAVNEIGLYLSESADKLKAANVIILGLCGRRMSKELDADIVAKCLVQRVIEDKEGYDPDSAYEFAVDKMQKLYRKMPEVLKSETAVNMEETTASGRANKNNNQKKARAEEIYNRMKGENTQSAIAKAIAAELEISFANAFYYVSRVFK